MNMWNMNKQREMIRRRSDGSIDSDHYIQRARKLRAVALKEYLARGNRWMLKQVRTLARLVKQAPIRLKKANHLGNATLHVPAGGARIKLFRGRLIRVQDGEGFRIRCHLGRLWITQEHDSRDVILRSGDAFVLDRPGLTLVAALADGEFTVEDPQRAIVSCNTKKSYARIKDWDVNYARA